MGVLAQQERCCCARRTGQAVLLSACIGDGFAFSQTAGRSCSGQGGRVTLGQRELCRVERDANRGGHQNGSSGEFLASSIMAAAFLRPSMMELASRLSRGVGPE